MLTNNNILNRRSIRIHEYDYAESGAYFITLCTQNREHLFGNIVNSEIFLNGAGQMIQSIWRNIPSRFPNTEIDQFIIMPNHMHGIIINSRGEPCVRPFQRSHDNACEHKVRPYGTAPNSIGRIIQAFKSITTHQYTMGVAKSGWIPFAQKCWQRNYWERIIRNDIELQAVRQYIESNPAKWPNDN